MDELVGVIPDTDRGFQFGDGLFETIAIKGGQLRLWPAHRARLERGLGQLKLSVRGLDWRALEGALAEQQSGGDGALKVIVTAGDGSQGYRRSDGPLRWVISRRTVPPRPVEWWTRGVQLHLCETRLGKNPLLAGVKHLNRLEQVLARSEWDDSAIADGVMLNTDGEVICTTMANLFCLEETVLRTPELSECGVRGVMRARVIEEARALGLEVREQTISLQQLLGADEVFVTNALIGLWPVRQVGAQAIASGPVANSLLDRVAIDALVPHL